jgi:DNA-binding transcriptional MocR family regulator
MVSRSTIVQVYDLLKIGHLIESRPGSGYQVKKAVFKAANLNEAAKTHARHPALSESGKAFLAPHLIWKSPRMKSLRSGRVAAT